MKSLWEAGAVYGEESSKLSQITQITRCIREFYTNSKGVQYPQAHPHKAHPPVQRMIL